MSAAAKPKPRVESLIQQCQHYIAMYVDEIPVSHLSLLPLSARRDILWRLPLADVCQLEDTDFAEGLDMAAYWKSPQEIACNYWWPNDDIRKYIQTEWDDLEYARAALFGQLTSCAVGIVDDEEFQFFLSYQREDYEYMSQQYISAISLLYAVRKPNHNLDVAQGDKYRLVFPSRYSHKSGKLEKDLTVPEVMKCFSKEGELPKVFPKIEIYSDVERGYAAIVPYYLRSAVYIGVKGHIFTEQGLNFVKAIIKEATQLEVLLLDDWGEDDVWEKEFCNDFIAFLCSYPRFFSTFRMFKILCSIAGDGFIISRENFNNLMTTYFTAPTDHMQKLQFTQAKILCSDIAFECSPTIDQKYLDFKTVEFDSCQFVSKYKATPQAISHWLGQGISELPRLETWFSNPDAHFFKIKDECMSGGPALPQKRKYSELESNRQNLDQAEN